MPTEKTSGRFRFSIFEVNADSGELLRQGVRIKLQEQPFRLLVLLLERAGEVVSRDELRGQLWPEDTFVEFDNSLNVAVRKLRDALRDDAETPRFVETLPRRGYRFVAPVTSLSDFQDENGRNGKALPFETQAPKAGGQLPPQLQPTAGKFLRLKFAAPAIAVVLAATALGAYLYRSSRFHLLPDDSVVLADFVNTTGDAVFDDSLRQASAVGLGQSTLFKIVSDRKTAAILKQMGRSADERVTGPVAIELCQRAGSKVLVQGSVSSLGTSYLIGLAAIRCDSGAPIGLEQAQAKRREEVVDALGTTASRLRARLGESLPSIQKNDVPLEQATTASLEALKAYSLALTTWNKQGDQASLPLFQKAVALDPKFAKGYASLAVVCHNLGENDLARANATTAYDLRDRVTDQERLAIESWYHRYVTGDLYKAAQIYEAWIAVHPSNVGAYANLGSTYAALGNLEKSSASFREAMRLDPLRANSYGNLALALIENNKLDEARATVDEAARRNLQSELLLQAAYWIAFLRGDPPTMQRLLAESSKVPGAEALLLQQESNTEAFYGRFAKGDELSLKAATLLEHDADKEAAALALAEGALREGEAEDSAQARRGISQANKIAGATVSDDLKTIEALALARIGDLKQAEALVTQLNQEHPSSTELQGYWLPAIRAEIELRRGQPARAIDALKASAQMELASPPLLSTGSIYPAFVRGQAYLAAGDPAGAAAEFQKLIDHPGLVVNLPIGALARLGVARAHAAAHLPAARSEYAAFLTLWKDANPRPAILKEAEVEYAKLQREKQ